MTTNPMKKRARISFLLGVLITLLICAIIGALIYFMVIKPKEEQKKNEEIEKMRVYVLNKDVESGDIITADMLTQVETYITTIPSNYVDASIISTLSLKDTNGNILYTNSDGQKYINQESQKYEVTKNNKIIINEDADGYYKMTKEGTKEYVQFLKEPILAKIAMKKNTILTSDSIVRKGEVVTDDLRQMEYSMLTLPSTVMPGDYVDIRLTLPNGQDLIVLSKKQIKSISGEIVIFELTEDEILTMDSAIVEAYIMTASKLYVTQYVEPGMQEAAVKTYTPTKAVRELIEADRNITESAKRALAEKYIANSDGDVDGGIRSYINGVISIYADSAQSSIESGIQQEIEKAKAAREAYLSTMNSY